MERAPFNPNVQVFVCTNARASDDPLQSGCGTAGLPLYAALKREVSAVRRVSDVWITRSGCMGHCPQRGCSVAIYPHNEHWIGATEGDAAAIAARAVSR